MGEEYLLLGDIPLDFQKVLMRAFVPYSVGLARVSQDDPKLFTALGSGTLVRKGTHIGVLSAQHCLTACSPRIRVGPSGKDSLLLILRDARGVQLPPEDLSITVRDGWDYIDNKCVYSKSSALPQSFAGFSGGGIWSVQVQRSKNTGKLSTGKAALVGASFYETPIENNIRYVRGHFIRSIYDLAWRNFERSQR